VWLAVWFSIFMLTGCCVELYTDRPASAEYSCAHWWKFVGSHQLGSHVCNKCMCRWVCKTVLLNRWQKLCASQVATACINSCDGLYLSSVELCGLRILLLWHKYACTHASSCGSCWRRVSVQNAVAWYCFGQLVCKSGGCCLAMSTVTMPHA
jgi:hypothetical protein